MLKVFQFVDGVCHKIDTRTLEQAKAHDLSDISMLCSQAISDAGLNEITQQNAALGIYPPERCEAIKNYIAACRNEYLRCKALILAATNNDEADSVTYQPPVPENL